MQGGSSANGTPSPQEEFKAFAGKFGVELTIAPAAEHWFHTAEQLSLLKSWEKRLLP